MRVAWLVGAGLVWGRSPGQQRDRGEDSERQQSPVTVALEAGEDLVELLVGDPPADPLRHLGPMATHAFAVEGIERVVVGIGPGPLTPAGPP